MGKNNVQWVNQRTKWAIFNSKLLVYQRVHPPNHHFYRWYLYHSQSWVVYGIVLPTLIIHHILWDEAHERTIRPDGPSATSWLASSSSGALVQKLMHLPSDRNPWNWYENGMKMVGKYMKIYGKNMKIYQNGMTKLITHITGFSENDLTNFYPPGVAIVVIPPSNGESTLICFDRDRTLNKMGRLKRFTYPLFGSWATNQRIRALFLTIIPFISLLSHIRPY